LFTGDGGCDCSRDEARDVDEGLCFKNRYWDIIRPLRPSYTLLAIDP